MEYIQLPQGTFGLACEYDDTMCSYTLCLFTKPRLMMDFTGGNGGTSPIAYNFSSEYHTSGSCVSVMHPTVQAVQDLPDKRVAMVVDETVFEHPHLLNSCIYKLAEKLVREIEEWRNHTAAPTN